MKLYRVIQSVSLGENQKFNKHILLENTMKIYVKLKKKSKSHRSVLDQQMADLVDIETNTFTYDHVVANVIGKNEIKTEGTNELIGELVKKMSCEQLIGELVKK